jgi:hypothetical protein
MIHQQLVESNAGRVQVAQLTVTTSQSELDILVARPFSFESAEMRERRVRLVPCLELRQEESSFGFSLVDRERLLELLGRFGR